MKSLEFSGNGGEYFKIWIVNILLTIVTLSLYLPWAKVRTRRYFYANTSLDGRNFEYHATGKQLFPGHLLVVFLVIIFIVTGKMFVQASAVIALLIAIAFPWILWKSMKFNFRMTSFSNVRFSFHGSLVRAYASFFAYPLLALLGAAAVFYLPIAVYALGLLDAGSPLGLIVGGIWALLSPFVFLYLFALVKTSKTRYLIDGIRYGQGLFETELLTKRFVIIMLKASALILLLVALTLGVTYFISGVNISDLLASLEDEEFQLSDDDSPILAVFGLLPVAFFLLSALFQVLVLTRDRRYIFKGTRLDSEISFASSLRARQLLGMIFTNLLLLLVTLGLAYPWARVRMTRLLVDNSHVQAANGFDHYLTQKEEEHSSVGDQIGEAFDMDVGIGI